MVRYRWHFTLLCGSKNNLVRHSFIRPSSIWLLATKPRNYDKLIQCDFALLEQFSLECQETKTRVTLWPITKDKNQSKLDLITYSCARKCVPANHGWFFFWLDYKVARVFQNSHDVWWYKPSCFSTEIAQQRVFINIGNDALRLTNWRQFSMRLSCYWSWVLS